MIDRTERICPYCGKRNDAHQPAPGQHEMIVTEGSALICAYCGNIAIATETGARIPGKDELAEYMANEAVRSAHRFVNERIAPKLARRAN